ncbi:MAG TPA: polysaccharide deacetylase family protein [Gaiellales bacterium]|jgi:peptidoglycan/xylan/chitin deacetylase (PgdA/CDA1 family)
MNVRWIAAHRGRPPVVLTYHAVGRVSPLRDHNALFCPAATVLRHARALRRAGYTLTTFGDLAERVQRGGGARLAAVTFDDGFRSTADFLRRSRLPATVFVVAGWLGKPHPHAAWTTIMSEQDVSDLSAGGTEIGSHTMSHPDLALGSHADALAEWTESRVELERLTGRPVEVAAYPFGRAADAAARACGEAGFRFAALTDGDGQWADPLRMPRQPVTATTGRLGLVVRVAEAHRATVTLAPLAAMGAASRELRRVREVRRTSRGSA